MTSELLGRERLYFINTQLRSSVGSPWTSPGHRCHRSCMVQGTVEDSGFSEVTTDWIQCFIQASSCTPVQLYQGPVRTTRPGSPAKWIHKAGHYDLRGFPLLHTTLSWLTLGLRYKCSGVPAACLLLLVEGHKKSPSTHTEGSHSMERRCQDTQNFLEYTWS